MSINIRIWRFSLCLCLLGTEVNADAFVYAAFVVGYKWKNLGFSYTRTGFEALDGQKPKLRWFLDT